MVESTTAESEHTPKRSAWKLRSLALLFGLAVALLLGEFVVFLSGVNNHYRAPATSFFTPRQGGPYDLAQYGYVPYSTLTFTYSSNPRSYFDANDQVHHVFNSEGWRDDETTEKKPEKTYRILGLGDSYLFGQGVKRKDLFLEQVEKRLTEVIESVSVETINSGQPAYNTSMELRLLQERGLAYSPDLVVLCFVPNDVEPDIFTAATKVEFFTEFTNSYATNDWLTEYSELWMFLKRSLRYQFVADNYLHQLLEDYREKTEKWQSCRQSLLKIQSVCQDDGIPLLMVNFPFFINLDGDYPFQLIHDQMGELCRSEGIPFLDLRESFRGFSGPELWVHPTDQHPNEKAHAIVAEAVTKKIIDEGWLPD